jgi:sugar phosphate isomerase/epimerase
MAQAEVDRGGQGKPMFYVSTGGRRDQTAVTTANAFAEVGIGGVELSGGKFDEDYEARVRKLAGNVDVQIHNWYPPSSPPFVLNLASTDDDLAARSIDHVRSAIRLAGIVGSRYYGVHSGFLVDPEISSLGSKFPADLTISREGALELFCDRVIELGRDANEHGVSLLIENNVINQQNISPSGENPFLCGDPTELVQVLNETAKSARLLMDVAHLKVSANSLGFDMHQAHKTLLPWIVGYHISDNNGEYDTNESISDQSWFWDDINKTLDYYVLEVYGVSEAVLYEQYMLLSKKISNSE